jgi:glycosyltransferase involved in cell wall biosynthesis
LESVKAWVCVSEFLRDKFIECGLPKERVFGLRHAWEPMEHPPVAEDGGYYLFLSRLVDEKGVEVLLRAWESIYANLGPKTPQLWIAGEGPLEPKVRAAAARNPFIHFRGMLRGAEKVETIRRCRAMMVPSVWWEPLGLVTCEAYDYSKPVLAARSGGLTETIRDGITGFLHKPGNELELKRDVITMEAMTSERRAELGRAGRQWLLEDTSVAAWKRKFSLIADPVVAAYPQR